jgi:hypothetical protein
LGTINIEDTWTFYSNPAKKETDGEALLDFKDPDIRKYDTFLISETDEYYLFNSGRKWYKIKYTSSEIFQTMLANNNVELIIPAEVLNSWILS